MDSVTVRVRGEFSATEMGSFDWRRASTSTWTASVGRPASTSISEYVFPIGAFDGAALNAISPYSSITEVLSPARAIFAISMATRGSPRTLSGKERPRAKASAIFPPEKSARISLNTARPSGPTALTGRSGAAVSAGVWDNRHR
jgi:hypothetical protein